MNLRKSVFSYIILAVFVFLSGFCIFCTLETAGFTRMFGWPLPALIGGVCIYLLLTTAVFMAFRAIFQEIGKHIKDRKRTETVLGAALPILTILGVAVYLLLYLIYHIPITLDDDTFYNMALVKAGNSVTGSLRGVSGLYVRLLHGMLLMFGNTPFAGVVLQIILFFICLALLYTGMRAYAGALPAAVSTAAFGFFSVSMEYVFSLTPELFYLALYLMGFYLTGVLYHKFCRPDTAFSGCLVPALFAGLYAGFLVCLDFYSVSLYFFFAICCSADKEKIKQAFFTNVVEFFAGIGGFFLSARVFSMPADSRIGEADFALQGENILELFRLPDYACIVFLLIISMAFFVVPGFFLQKKSQNSAFILNLFLLYGLRWLGINGPRGQMAVILGWCMIAGPGIYGTIRQSEKAAGKESPESDKEESLKETDMEEKKTKNQEQKKPAPGEPLPNPLPVPKKKNRQQADFAHQVAEADMKFDVEVADNDDFDV